MLERNGAALCWVDRGSHPVSPLWRTADWGYIRLHQGRGAGYHYGSRALEHWAERIQDMWTREAAVHVYFNNDVGGAAVDDVVAFARTARRAGLEVSRTSEMLEPAADGGLSR